MIGHTPSPRLIDALSARGIDFAVGDSVIETDAGHAAKVLDVIRSLEQPQILSFNRGRLMVLPPGIAKSIGLARVLSTLRLSIHNTIGIGDAENDHDLLDACEVGVAVEWGSPALRVVADEVIREQDLLPSPHICAAFHASFACRRSRWAVADCSSVINTMAGRCTSPFEAARCSSPANRVGQVLAGRVLCEQLILQGYCLCIIDPRR